MHRVLLSSRAEVRSRWSEAFPDDQCVADGAAVEAMAAASIASLWLDAGAGEASGSEEAARVVESAAGRQLRLVVMTSQPTEAGALGALQSGAQGYCHLHAAPQQLREIALVVENGGLWMPPEFMRRFLLLSTRVTPRSAVPEERLKALTERERAVAEQVARGASNREIAASLSISERTVKSHLTTVFDKLGCRDRVQLALAMNNVPSAPPQD